MIVLLLKEGKHNRPIYDTIKIIYIMIIIFCSSVANLSFNWFYGYSNESSILKLFKFDVVEMIYTKKIDNWFINSWMLNVFQVQHFCKIGQSEI